MRYKWVDKNPEPLENMFVERIIIQVVTYDARVTSGKRTNHIGDKIRTKSKQCVAQKKI